MGLKGGHEFFLHSSEISVKLCLIAGDSQTSAPSFDFSEGRIKLVACHPSHISPCDDGPYQFSSFSSTRSQLSLSQAPDQRWANKTICSHYLVNTMAKHCTLKVHMLQAAKSFFLLSNSHLLLKIEQLVSVWPSRVATLADLKPDWW